MNWYKKAQEKEHDLTCPECGSKLKLRKSDYGLYYRCENYPKCKVTHGAFKDGKPRGIPGDLETIALRKAAHNKINELIKNEPNPKEAQQKYYNWLANKLNVPKNLCHMSLFDKETLRRVIGICNYLIEQKKKRQEELKFQPELKLNANINIKQEAGVKENILTMALTSLLLLPLDIMAFKHIKSRKPDVPTELIIDNLKQAKQIKENVETGKYTPEEKKVYDEANVLKNEIKLIKPQQNKLVVTNNVVNVVKQLEGSNFNAVSGMGASGIMQVMKPAWEEINKEKHNGKYPYYKYRFNKKINMMFGKEYLEKLAQQLEMDKNQWKADPYFLLFAAYNTGLGHVKECKYDAKLIFKKHPEAHNYAIRGTNLLGAK